MSPFALTIYYDPNILLNEVREVATALARKAPSLIIKELKELSLSSSPYFLSTYDTERNQYNGQKLLNYLINHQASFPFLWIISYDLYVPSLNFVFGLGTKDSGAIVSFFRLPSIEMKFKESLHETGHVIGLAHCRNYCVMQFSNSLREALKKPSEFCDACKAKIARLIH